MPKKIPKENFDEHEFDEDDEEFEEDEEDEIPPIPKRPIQKNPKLKPRPQTQQIKRRYAVYAPQPLAIADVETGEKIGEGDYTIYQALANIIERLERIEDTIGNMVD